VIYIYSQEMRVIAFHDVLTGLELYKKSLEDARASRKRYLSETPSRRRDHSLCKERHVG
jgi:hypothetical protein